MAKNAGNCDQVNERVNPVQESCLHDAQDAREDSWLAFRKFVTQQGGRRVDVRFV